MFSQLQREATAIVETCVQLSWYMRGGVSYDSLLLKTPGERQIIGDFVVNRMESQKGVMHPVY